MQTRNVLFIEWDETPDHIRQIIRDCDRWSCDAFIPHYSEMEICKDADYFNKEVDQYFKDQTEENGYTKTRKMFIIDYGLVVDQWIYTVLKPNVDNIDLIMFGFHTI